MPGTKRSFEIPARNKHRRYEQASWTQQIKSQKTFEAKLGIFAKGKSYHDKN